MERLEDHLDDMRALVFGMPPLEERYHNEEVGKQTDPRFQKPFPFNPDKFNPEV